MFNNPVVSWRSVRAVKVVVFARPLVQPAELDVLLERLQQHPDRRGAQVVLRHSPGHLLTPLEIVRPGAGATSCRTLLPRRVARLWRSFTLEVKAASRRSAAAVDATQGP